MEEPDIKEIKETKSRSLNKSFQVVIRLCPQEQKSPLPEDMRSCIKVKEPNQIIADSGRGHQPHMLEFDAVWDESASQKDVYESTAKPLVDFVLQGYNGCVITYGSAGSGKTYTLQGGSLTGKQRGIITRVAEDVFRSPETSNCKIRASFIHISNEKIYDLLDGQPAEVCRIHESEETVFLEGLTEVEVTSAQSLLQLYRRGTANRHTGVLKGEFASKSHTIFNIIVINTPVNENDTHKGTMTASKLTLVDLASSGRVPTSGVISDGKRSFQAAHPNPQEVKMLKRSLTIFGNVIFALSSAGCQHIPYRESKLTRILRDCLGGNCLTSLIVTVSPNLSSVTETLSSLQFASRAMAVPNRAVRGSQLHCGAAQVLQNTSTKVTEKPQSSHSRQRAELPCVSDKKGLQAQMCLPPILSSPAPPSWLSHRKQEGLSRREGSAGAPEQKAFLPHLEGTGEGSPQSARPLKSRPGEERGGRGPWSRSSSTAGPPAPEPPRDKPPRGEPHSPRISADRLPADVFKAHECPHCKKERKIREEYDKYVVQVRGDKDALLQRISELDAELRRCREEQEATTALRREEEVGRRGTRRLQGEAERQGNTMGSGTELLHLENEIKQKQQEILQGLPTSQIHLLSGVQDLLSTEMGGLKAQLEKTRGNERALALRLHTEQSRAAQETDELRAQLERHREREKQQECIFLELQDTRAELENFRERVTITLAELKKEKDGLLIEIEETKNYNEKVKAENASLVEKLEVVQLQLSSRAFPGYCIPPHVHTVTTNTEMMVSHHMSQQGAVGITSESKCSFNSCSGFQSSTFTHPTMPSAAFSVDEDDLLKKDIYKQLKRERNLLLDVMVIMYTRRWFVDDAMPHVRRALKKCGMRLEEAD
ncbi:kinesin-like protein KIF3C isoform X2 [Lepisosteus oculatus]|uniref:kinesin-like protein KIF3C isoform X2 n=1 Tax=Lepisosteus oculatus TaxID=7918 RepID=UPI0035F514AD